MRYNINKPAVKARIEREAVPKLTHIGERTLAFVQRITPVDSGKLQKSEHFTVVDGSGNVVAGQTTDGNGNPVPAYGGDGNLRVIVATNEGADDGKFYGHFPEYGTRGQPGKGFFARGYDAMREIADSEFR